MPFEFVAKLSPIGGGYINEDKEELIEERKRRA